ncbi:thioredoxin [Algoriphagus halophytocola]|uniref:Thioredoxin n=1 Tax=Algoriphagus halophytocola TaxID=2991499 RepID=A0ABY6MM89_9BACT|nr:MULTISPECIES: thioredoxin [unclassified Algoriphagus]UZD24783.1 thioredoxin [Algoriphagus sp. TR-M5]WBL45171.1 thioredoxin [Algoriphagus sp. TR-M9]
MNGFTFNITRRVMPKRNPKDIINKSQDAVLVDFYADWCGPCQTMDPIIAEVLDELGGKIKLLKINVDKHPQLAQQFAIRSIPNYILFKKGKILWRKGGLITKRDLEKALKGFA